jgi:DNA-binding NarL/FixJ family response regulator
MGSFQNIAIIEKDSESCLLFANAVHEISVSADTHCFGNAEDLVNGTDWDANPDIIFLDISLNKGNGFNAIKFFKETRAYKDIPIIIFSNSQDHQDIAELYILGASRYFIKPVVYTQFITVLRQIITREMDVIEESGYDNFIIQPRT